MSIEAKCITFYGPDGCGKSTVATSLAEIVSSKDAPTTIIGGSSYREWLTPAMARDFLGSCSGLDNTALTPEEKTRLYEDIAIVCYGQAERLAEEGQNVIIDSDPYLKRFIWAQVEDPEGYQRYAEQFEERVAEHLGEECFPDWIVGVNMTNEPGKADLLSRIQQRGGNSDYDPTTADETEKIIRASRAVWTDLIAAGRYKRLNNAERLTVVNADCQPELVAVQGLALAVGVYRHIYEAEAAVRSMR